MSFLYGDYGCGILMAANSTFYSDDVILLGVDQEFVGLHIAMWTSKQAGNGLFGCTLHRWSLVVVE